MLNGFVLYRDILEQKGIILYALHSIGYLISNTTFFGVYLIQVLSFSVFLLFVYKTCTLFLSVNKALAIVPLTAMVALTCDGYANGDRAEEFCLPLMAIGLYTLFKYFNKSVVRYKTAPLWVMLVNGVCGGIVLWIKYTMLGFWLGLLGVVLIICFSRNKNADGLKHLGMFLLGGFLVTLLCVGYFVVNGAVDDMINTYFLINIFSYSANAATPSLLQKLLNTLLQVGMGMGQNLLVAIITVLGLAGFTISKRFIKTTILKILYIPLFLITLSFIYIGGTSWAYYYFITSGFMVAGFITLFTYMPIWIRKIFSSTGYVEGLSSKARCAMLILVTVSSIAGAYFFSSNTKMIGVPQEITSQYVIAKEIQKVENSTILNYGCLDGGFYTVTGKLPVTKYFCKLNIPYKAYPEMVDTQNSIIRNAAVDFVIINTYKKEFPPAEEIPYLLTNYRLVTECSSKNNKTGDYSLYIRKSL